MKRLIALLFLSGVLCAAEEITLPKATVIRTQRGIVSVKAGAVVEVLSRDEKTLTVRFNNITGTIPAASVTAEPEPKKKAEAPAPSAPPAEKGAQTNYGKAVQKAKENAGKHDKNVAKPVDEVTEEK